MTATGCKKLYNIEPQKTQPCKFSTLYLNLQTSTSCSLFFGLSKLLHKMPANFQVTCQSRREGVPRAAARARVAHGPAPLRHQAGREVSCFRDQLHLRGRRQRRPEPVAVSRQRASVAAS